MNPKRRSRYLANCALMGSSILAGLMVFGVVDLIYSKLNKQDPFAPPALSSNGVPLYRQGKRGWYELNANYNGQDRYGKLVFNVNTDAHGFRTASHSSKLAKHSSKTSIVLIGDSFTYGVGTEWSDTFGSQLSLMLHTPVINAGVNSHSPTAHLYRLKTLLATNAIPPKAVIVMAIDISDVQDEATRWRDGKPTPIDITHQPAVQVASNAKNEPAFFSPQNFKFSHQIYYFFEGIVKHFIDNMQVRNQSRSAFTHRPWQSLNRHYEPLGVRGGLARIQQQVNNAAVLSQQQDHPFYLLIYPWPAQLGYANHFRWDQAIRSFCKKPACSGVINSIPRFEAAKSSNRNWQNTYYIRGDMHFNAIGNRVIAQSVADQMRKDHRL